MSWTTRIRVLYQAFFLLLFVWLLDRLAAGDPRAFPFTAFHHADPLTAAGTALAAGTIPGALVWSAALIALTLVLGRAFCGWICPLGTLQQLASFLFSGRSRRESLNVNRYRRWYALKYYILAALLVGALAGTLQTGLLDPLSLAARGLASGLWPVLPGGRPAPGGWIAALLLLGILVASRWIPRLFCRAFCPLGAFLGVFARFAVFRIHRGNEACTSCTLCAFACQGADEPLGNHRAGECMVCLNCLPACPEQAMGYGALPPLAAPPRQPDLSRRTLVGTVLTALAVAPLLRAAGGGRAAARPRLVRPPGALAEADFLERCVKCSLCQQACPTGAIQAAIAEAGVEGFWTPVVVPRRGWCEFACTRCGEVCPTAAITRMTAARKTGYDGKPPVRIGTAFVDRGRCLPWAMGTPCIVCEEMCPTDPKAIWLETVEEAGRDGAARRLQRPRVDASRCVGCGICENKCPVGEEAAIRVSSVGETRNPLNRLLAGSASS
ncbi:MAG: 4Fe-4S binding protein [Thermoanaerobaculaceae bacterium]|nr:4Fe-4S binding protein [Thermoanaerobaculaceae bacterium]TAM56855.1 MAG: 4Fe-4S binding protein [Acidobacteriota bacterium]